MPTRIAIIGLGHGRSHATSIARDPRLQLSAVVDPDPQRRQQTSQQMGVPAFHDVGELLDAGVADAAVAAVPTPVHAEVACQLLDGGLHVLLEKPLCRDEAEAARIGDSLARSGRVLQIGYCVRSSQLHQRILRHIARGDLGDLSCLWYHQHTLDKRLPGEWRADRENMGGKLFDCAVHYLDLMQQWAGAPVHRVMAMGNDMGQVGPEAEQLPSTAVICLEYANGVRGTYNFSEVTQVNDDASFGLVGTTGRIMGNPWLPDGAGSFELRTDRGAMVADCVFDPKLTSPGHLGFAEEMTHFADSIVDGAPNICPYEDALALHHQMRAIDRSLATGQPVTLPAD